MAEANDEVVRDWNFGVNLSGVIAPTGTGGNDLPEGYYEVVITEAYTRTDNPDRIIFKAVVAKGPYKGVVRTDGIGRPKSDDDKVRHYWRAIAESVGFGPKQLDNGEIGINADTFVNKAAFIHFRPKDESKGDAYKFEKVTWLAPTTWNQQKQNSEMMGGASVSNPKAGGTGSALGSTAEIESPTPLGGGGNAVAGTTSKSAIYKILGANA